ncbi:MAG TPA: LuxR C-terminal-related transcriptional regulator [Streptosporangiaceae bacterium]|nr:LuxR C-terminal-related transcriptional regulator [Streptosporangiaceae bacterium]
MLLHTDDLPQALAACDLLVDMAAAGGAPARHATSMALRAGTLHRLGWLADAAAECEQALPAALSARAVRQVSCLIVSIYLGILIDQGELSKASVLLVRTGLVGQLPRSWHYNDVLYARARLRTAGGAVAEGLSDYLECGQRMTGWGVRNPAVSDWRSRAAMAYAALGERDEALRLAAEEVELAESAGGARALGVALARLAEITGGSGGIQLACRAVRLLTATNAALDEAAARAVLGAMLLARGMRAAGEQQVRHAHRTAEARGATVLARQAARVLHEHGIPAGGGQPSGRVSLTEAERRVLALAEMGLSNQQIAHRLRVVLRTVEIHLTRGYRKLGIRGRTELPGQVTGPTLLGLSPPRS